MGMFDEKVSLAAGSNLRALADLTGVNSITDAANGLISAATSDEQKARFIEYFYDKMLLDTIKLGSEHNVYLKYCKTQEVPKGHSKLMLRRWGALTEHTVPLAEGIPPKSDQMRSESFTGTFAQFGRYMEFTDRIDFMLIDPVMTHYNIQMGDVAVRTGERLCREEMVAAANPVYANSRANIGELVVGDVVNISDYRLQALKFQRRYIKPLTGSYVIICSPEHIYDLVNDPLVVNYMQYTNTAEPLKTGKPVELFNIRFEETMLDDFALNYVEMANPGEYLTIVDNQDVYCNRIYAVVPEGNSAIFGADGTTALAGGTVIYGNIVDSTGAYRSEELDVILQDGSRIPRVVKWDIASFIATLAATDGVTASAAIKLTYVDADGAIQHVAGASVGASNYAAGTLAALKALMFRQLPVHRSFMFGDEHMIKTGISGESGAKFYIKAKGSAGVLDPIDQRQSIGFKINTLGFNLLREDAIVQFLSVPTEAITTFQEVLTEYATRYSDSRPLLNIIAATASAAITFDDTTGAQAISVVTTYADAAGEDDAFVADAILELSAAVPAGTTVTITAPSIGAVAVTLGKTKTLWLSDLISAAAPAAPTRTKLNGHSGAVTFTATIAQPAGSAALPLVLTAKVVAIRAEGAEGTTQAELPVTGDDYVVLATKALGITLEAVSV